MAKVLLVEDDNNLREIYEARLAAEGYDISSAQDGEEALVVAKQTKPDLVVSDVMMPKISGFEMLDILRNTPGLEHVKVIMLTALGQSEDRDRADSLGADKYLVKSQVTLEDIVKTAHELLGDDEAPAAAAPGAATAAAVASETTPVAEPEAVAPAPTPAVATPVEPVAPVAAPVDTPSPTDDVLAQAAASLTAPSDETPSATPTEPPIQPVEVAPSAIEPTPAEVTAPSEAAPTELAGSAIQEQSALAEQINNFVQEAPAVEPEVAPATETSSEAVAPSTDNTTATADDQLMAEAVTELTNNVEGTEAPTATTPAVETPETTPPESVGPEAPQIAADAKQEAEKTTISISGKKTIQPLDSEPTPDINELLAREEATSGNPVTGAAVISGDDEGDTEPKQTEIDETPAIIHQPGQSFAPQPQTESTIPAPAPASGEDVPSGGPAPAPSDKDSFDPNSVAL
jgi:CheY-like chemotaxis protein